MRIRMYYESKLDKDIVVLDVPDDEYEIMVETDYQERLAKANPEDRDKVTRRNPQTIVDEECNKPTFNNHHKETRRHVSLETLDPEGDHIPNEFDTEESILPDEYDDLYRAIERLRPHQRDLIKKIYWEEMRQGDVAEMEGVSEQAMHNRMVRIYERLRAFLSEKK